MKNLLITSSVPDTEGKIKYVKRLALSLIKQNRLRRDVISEVLHLLRLRYSLAEKVYYHHAKIVASAMIIEAVQAAILQRPDIFNEKALCEMSFGDDELLFRLQESKVPISVKLANNIKLRKLYKSVYELNYSPKSQEDLSWDKN
jgi:HD superfamily phosphohydrolase